MKHSLAEPVCPEPPPSEEVWEYSGLADLMGRWERLARSDVPLLILGETGAGKSSLARWFHANSPRSEAPCVVRGCGTFHDQAFVATMFGYEKGAYTGADKSERGLLRGCDQGTLILDDIDTLSLSSQARLLQFIDTRNVTPLGSPNEVHTVNIRLIATTNQDMHSLISRGLFREDLYYRIATFRISLPPLSARKIDTAKLVRRFESELVRSHPMLSPRRPFSESAVRLITLFEWPGNLRELRSAVFQTQAFANPVRRGAIGLEEFFDLLVETEVAAPQVRMLRERLSQDDRVLLEILRCSDWNISLVARIAGLSRPTIYKKINYHSWSRERDC